jgi:hypothetical protein
MKKTVRRYSTATIAMFLVSHILAPGAHAQLQTISTIYGATYGELAARWWEWVFSIPFGTNPVADQTGVNCGVGQTGKIWFLAGTFGGPATRNCTIPAGVAIFFPIVNGIAFAPDPTDTMISLRKQAAGVFDPATNLRCTLDDHPCAPNLLELRAQSPVFEAIVPPDGIWSPGLLNPMVADGYWMLLTPLRAGHHVLKFGGTAPTFSVDMTYNLTIQDK